MSKVVKIPTTMNPFVVIVNGVEHKYPAGVTMEVPDNVAAIIEQYEKGSFPQPQTPETVINMVSPRGYVFKVTVSDEGELVVTGELFTFNWSGKLYTAKRGMTWGEWANSKYAPVEVCRSCGCEHPTIGLADGYFGIVQGCTEEGQELVVEIGEYTTEEGRDSMDVDECRTVGYDSVIDFDKFYGDAG